MREARVYKTEAIILRQTKLGEADRIVSFFTPYLGKLRAVAKGVRRPGSRLGGHLEPFTHVSLMLARGQNLDIITQAQTVDGFLPLRQDLRRTSLALYGAELVDRFAAEGVENRSIFLLLRTVLGALNAARDIDAVIRFFEVRLLEHLGYRPHLDDCLRCRRSVAVGPCFSPSAGGILCPVCRGSEPVAYPISAESLRWLRALQSEEANALQALVIPPSASREVALRVGEYIRYLLEQEVRSAVFVEMLKKP